MGWIYDQIILRGYVVREDENGSSYTFIKLQFAIFMCQTMAGRIARLIDIRR